MSVATTRKAHRESASAAQRAELLAHFDRLSAFSKRNIIGLAKAFAEHEGRFGPFHEDSRPQVTRKVGAR